MRVVSWNCNGAFRKKYKHIQKLDADIYVIQECEDSCIVNDTEFKEFANNYIWRGNKNKGLGIFAKNNICVEKNDWNSFGLEWFLSCIINGKINLIALWGCGNYIEDICVYFNIYEDKIKDLDDVLICGDFNSNVCWDNKSKNRTHESLVKRLEDYGLESCYHVTRKEKQGNENMPTFYMYRKEEKSYHIDYSFYYKDKIDSFDVGKYDEWTSLSDHMPIVLDIK